MPEPHIPKAAHLPDRMNKKRRALIQRHHRRMAIVRRDEPPKELDDLEIRALRKGLTAFANMSEKDRKAVLKADEALKENSEEEVKFFRLSLTDQLSAVLSENQAIVTEMLYRLEGDNEMADAARLVSLIDEDMSISKQRELVSFVSDQEFNRDVLTYYKDYKELSNYLFKDRQEEKLLSISKRNAEDLD